jgi:hypothetical protein
VEVEHKHLTVRPEGLEVLIPHSKVDREGQWQTVPILRVPDSPYCPVSECVAGLAGSGGHHHRAGVSPLPSRRQRRGSTVRVRGTHFDAASTSQAIKTRLSLIVCWAPVRVEFQCELSPVQGFASIR